MPENKLIDIHEGFFKDVNKEYLHLLPSHFYKLDPITSGSNSKSVNSSFFNDPAYKCVSFPKMISQIIKHRI